ncbi:Uncharacterized protein APZ42_016896 [Daphnia magna]|uniref:Uncharacterized protein n=1 Tax=Daphnia magna TaxID=35525 RepID=A0A165A850_9CRUS|nr:Uncharacterized protein APZ42_016896 [Daphnia magna]
MCVCLTCMAPNSPHPLSLVVITQSACCRTNKRERVQCTVIASCATWGRGETIAPEGAGRDLLVGRRPPNRSSTPMSV